MRAGKLFQAIVVLGTSSAGVASGCAQSDAGNGPAAGSGRGGSDAASAGSGGSSVTAEGSTGGSGGDRVALYDGGSVIDGGSDPISLAGFGGASEPEGVFWPSACEYAYQYVCDSYVPLGGCRCDTTRPRGPEDCGGVRMTRCSEYSVVDRSAPFDPDDPELGFVDCRCVPENASSPEACEGFGQFVCNVVRAELRDCHCDPSRPKTPDACTKPEDFFCRSTDARDSARADCYCGEGDAESECPPDDFNHRFECQSETPRYGCRCQYVGIK